MDYLVPPINCEFHHPTVYYSDFGELNQLYSVSTGFISIFHLNARSFAKNGREILVFLSGLPCAPDVIVLTETWFRDDYVEEIDSYIGYHMFRQTRRGGGVSIFVKMKLRSKSIMQCSFIEDDLELCSIRLNVGGCQIAVVGIYRPPGRDIVKAIELLDPVMQAVTNNQRAFLVGDLNIDSINPCPAGNEFINFCYSYSFLPLINLPTHVTNNSSTCLDHIYYNQLDTVWTGVFKTDITDHYPVFVLLNVCYDNSRIVTKTFRDHSNFSLNKMKDELSFFCDNFHLNTGTYDDRFSLFVDGVQNIYDKCCPIRNKSMSFGRFLKPWISTSLIKCINRKHYLFKQYKRNLIPFERYNAYKNMLTSITRRAKERYYFNKFKFHVKDSKKTWTMINSLIRSKEKNRVIDEIEVEGTRIVDSQEIADCFSDHFSNAAIRLDRLVPAVEKSALDYLDNPQLMSMFVPPVIGSDVKRVMSELPTKSCDIKLVPAYIYKYFSDLLSPVIANLFNESVRLGTFPGRLKVARVVPVFKSGNKMMVTNYRPISTLPFLSKTFEKLMYKHLLSYLNSNNLICDHQFGFRQGFNTSDAVSELLDYVYSSLDNRKIMLSVFLDLSKAFDTVNHGVLMSKLNNLGIRGSVYSWFKSYIGDRKQYVSISNCNSSVTTPCMGVPQGSTLGPILFLLYINDMSRCSGLFKCVHFADDTTLLLDSHDPNQLVESVNRELLNVRNWLCANRLSLNIGKTSYMVVTDRDVRVPDVHIDGMIIEKVTEAKFLGITLDNRLNFVAHVDRLCKQVSRASGMLNRLSSVLPVSVRMKIYFALIYSKVNYGIISWGKSNLVSIGRLSRAIERAKRILRCSADSRKKLLNLNSIYVYSVCDKMYRITNMNQHSYFERVYSNLRPVHEYQTRFGNSTSFNIPMYSKSKCQRGYLFQSVKLWNNLPCYIRQNDTLSKFRRALKLYLRCNQE